jgi:hypothetical protein
LATKATAGGTKSPVEARRYSAVYVGEETAATAPAASVSVVATVIAASTTDSNSLTRNPILQDCTEALYRAVGVAGKIVPDIPLLELTPSCIAPSS